MRWVMTGALALLLSGCVQTTPAWDGEFGRSVRVAQQQQTLNPRAGGDAPVNGIEGDVGRETFTRYRNSFKEAPTTPNSFTIGVGR